jgi:para-nitrobenzyl esterase
MRPILHWLTLSLLISASNGVAVSRTLPSSPPTVTLQSGVLEGFFFNADGAAFLGIPYAAPPVGELRWKPPQPVRTWKGSRMATQFGAACPQRPANWFPYIGWNEDCLYLNVWTPQLSANARLPVLVYFHGGSNTQGYSQMTPLAPALAPSGILVVSANYRLGPFGFLALPALTMESRNHSSGNYGLLDQVQALQWVRQNIAHFGGDPSRITVMGQSAGAVDICLLMASPLAAGLFQGAIMESGDCQSVYNEDIRTTIPYNFISTTGEESGGLLAKDLGVANDAHEVQNLRNIPADAVLKAWAQDRRVHFDAIVDGWVIPEQPAKTFAAGRQMRIPVIVGSNADEATVFGHAGPKTVEEYKQYLSEDTGKYSAAESRLYPASSDQDVTPQWLRLQSDSFAYGAYSMAQVMSRVGQSAYLYYFTYTETGKRAHLGAYHGEELRFLCDSFPFDWENSTDDKRLGDAIRKYWTQFVKTGNPNARGLTNWAAYDNRASQWLSLGRTIEMRPIDPQLHRLEQIMLEVLDNTAKTEGSSHETVINPVSP